MGRCLSSLARIGALILLLSATLLATPPAQARDHITERAWLEDPTGQLALEQVRKLPLTTFQGVLSRGYGDSAIWVRLRIAPRARPALPPHGDGLVLRIRPVYLDDIQVFDPTLSDHRLAVTGDRHHPRGDVLRGLEFLVPVASASEPRDLWLRVASTSTRQIDVQALGVDDMAGATLPENLTVGLYLGLVLALLTWGAISWALTREALMAIFAVKQGAAWLFALSSFGVLRNFWPQTWAAGALDTLGSVFSITAVGAAVLFHIRFIEEFIPARWAWRLMYAAQALTPVCLLLLAIGKTAEALEINMLTILITPTIALACVLTGTAWSQADPVRRPLLPRAVVIAFYLMIVSFLVTASLSGLALVRGHLATIYVSQIHGLVTGVLLLILLQFRAHFQQQQQRQVMIDLERSKLQAQHEQQTRQEQEKLLAMLAHEIKTPLATMHMRLDPQASGSREIRQAIADMNGIIERCLQASQVGEGQLEARMSPQDLVHLARDAVAASSQSQRVRMKAPDKLVVQTDRQLLFVVLSNLLDNACKYSPADSSIELSLRLDLENPLGPGVELMVCNRPGAAGWPDPDRLFQKYYRAPHAQRQAGTGLGLYLVRSLVHTLGGGIAHVPDESVVRFVVRLPHQPGA